MSNSRVCERTGLVLERSCGRTVYRVARTKYGPFDPPARKIGAPPEELSRWDTPGRTIYAGTAERGAFIEVLSYITPDDVALSTMSDFFDDVTSDDELFLHEQIAKELAQHGGMRQRSVPRGWREDRNIYEFRLPREGWFVDITASDSIGALDEQLRTTLAGRFGIEELHVSHLTADGTDARAVTTYIATHVRSLVLDDGSLPHGIAYPSKYGTDIENYAVWLRRRDDGTESGGPPFDLVASNAINLHVEAFQSAVKRLRLTAY